MARIIHFGGGSLDASVRNPQVEMIHDMVGLYGQPMPGKLPGRPLTDAVRSRAQLLQACRQFRH